MVASHVIRDSIWVRDSLEAVWAARSSPWGLGGVPRPPDCRWYSSWISWKTATSGLGRNWSATAAISERRPDLRKARTNCLPLASAALNAFHFESMMAQEKMLKKSRIPSTVSAVGPLLCSISVSAPDWAAAGGVEMSVASVFWRRNIARIRRVMPNLVYCDGGGGECCASG